MPVIQFEPGKLSGRLCSSTRRRARTVRPVTRRGPAVPDSDTVTAARPPLSLRVVQVSLISGLLFELLDDA